MESIPFIAWCLEHLNYWVITLLMAIESSFIPFPSEVVVPPAAYLAATNGEMNVVLVVVCATIGALIGALINYALAYTLGRPLVYKFANSRLGNMCLIDQAKVEKAEKYFNDHGAIGTLVGRLVPAVRQLISIPAGLAKMELSKFVLYTSLGAAAWNSILAALGYYMASVVPYDQLDAKVDEYSGEVKIAMIALGAFVVIYLAYNFRNIEISDPRYNEISKHRNLENNFQFSTFNEEGYSNHIYANVCVPQHDGTKHVGRYSNIGVPHRFDRHKGAASRS